MVAVTKAVIRQDAQALARLVDEAVEHLPGEQLPAVAAILAGARNTIAALQPATPPPAPSTPDDYFPASAAPSPRATPRQLREANAQWDAATARGRAQADAALNALGALLPPGEVAARLGVSTSTVNNWRTRGKLLAVRRDDHQYLYPAFQFAPSPLAGEQGLIPHFAAVLGLLGGQSAWAQAQFFLTPAQALHGATPLAILQSGDRDQVDRVYRLAEQSGELGG